MTNLLTPQKRKERRDAYTIRIMIAVSSALAGTAFIAGLAFLPVYISLQGDSRAIEAEIGALAEVEEVREAQVERDALIQARKRVEALNNLFRRGTRATDVLKAIVKRRAEGIVISNIQYTFSDDNSYSVRISGSVDERRQLQSYISSLQADTLFSSATIPVSALADADRGVFVVTAEGVLPKDI